jgi:hypothetical protein
MYLYEGKCVCPIAVEELISFGVSKQSKPKLYVKELHGFGSWDGYSCV